MYCCLCIIQSKMCAWKWTVNTNVSLCSVLSTRFEIHCKWLQIRGLKQLYYSFHKNNNMIVQLKMHTCSLQRFRWSQQNCWCFLLYPNVHQYCEPNSTEGFHGSKEKGKERSWILKVSTAFVKCAVDSACAAVKTRVDVAYLPQTSEFIC